MAEHPVGALWWYARDGLALESGYLLALQRLHGHFYIRLFATARLKFFVKSCLGLSLLIICRGPTPELGLCSPGA